MGANFTARIITPERSLSRKDDLGGFALEDWIMLNAKQVAEKLETSIFTLDRLVGRDDLGFPKPVRYTPRGVRRWREADIDRWLVERGYREPSGAGTPAQI
jgi:predicted DNA-binding transcriptional regulator AlpA